MRSQPLIRSGVASLVLPNLFDLSRQETSASTRRPNLLAAQLVQISAEIVDDLIPLSFDGVTDKSALNRSRTCLHALSFLVRIDARLNGFLV